MSGSPSEAEIQTQWKNAVDLLESTRSYADTDVVGAAGLIDVLMQSLEGEYTPSALSSAAQQFRASLSSLVDQGRALQFLEPILREYAGVIDAGGSGFTDLALVRRAIYEHFVDNSLSVKTRAITFDSSATAGAGNVGNGAMSRLTVDENSFPLEACTVETKQFRCRSDQNTGANKQAEAFQHIGSLASYDALERDVKGSGARAQATIYSRHAGSGNGGSRLRNSTFSTYSASASPKFANWTESAGGASITQDTTNYYRGAPGTTTDASLKITGGAGTVTLKQAVTERVDFATPYFLRVMLNKTIGTALGGTVTIRMGSVSASVTIAALGAGWQELYIAFDDDCWPANFNEAPLDIEIEWSSSTSGYLLVDDVIFCPWDLIDGTYWILRGNATTHTPWLVDDTLEFTDTGGAPATGKIQWWLWTAGLGYLPSSGSPTLTDP